MKKISKVVFFICIIIFNISCSKEETTDITTPVEEAVYNLPTEDYVG